MCYHHRTQMGGKTRYPLTKKNKTLIKIGPRHIPLRRLIGSQYSNFIRYHSEGWTADWNNLDIHNKSFQRWLQNTNLVGLKSDRFQESRMSKRKPNFSRGTFEPQTRGERNTKKKKFDEKCKLGDNCHFFRQGTCWYNHSSPIRSYSSSRDTEVTLTQRRRGGGRGSGSRGFTPRPFPF